MAGGGEKGIKVEAEVSSVRVWMENRYLGTDVGYVHGYREAKLSLHVLSVVLENHTGCKVQESNRKQSVKCMICARYCECYEHCE